MKKIFASLGITVIVCAAGSLIMTRCGVQDLGWHAAFGLIVGYVVVQIML